MSDADRTRLRRTIAVCLYVLTAAWGAARALRPDNAYLWLLFSAAIASAMTGWCVVDSRILGRPIVRSLQWIIFFTWPIAVPLYLIWSRRFRGFAMAFLHALGLCALSIAFFIAAGYLAYGADWLHVAAE